MLTFQQIIMRLHEFWAGQGCVIWQPHNSQVGAGTSNPATVLRALGPEPWRVAYQEPSARPADGRYGENPNRWYEYYQYQVILKPAPANNIDLYLESLEAIGIDRRKHDIRFVEDNWESPSLGAWGLGWEIWLDGLEVTQYTYFQQVSGIDTNPVCVEITYGLERLALFLQNVHTISDIEWIRGLTYGDLHLADEIDYCKYNFDEANIARLQQMYQLFDEEARSALASGLVLPAHDYLLRCSHTFNVLDARGAIGVTQRAQYFARMRDLSHKIAQTYLDQRESLGYPFLNRAPFQSLASDDRNPTPVTARVKEVADLLLEIGVEELPAKDVAQCVEQLHVIIPRIFAESRLHYNEIRIGATPRRLIVYLEALSPMQESVQSTVKGPTVNVAYTADGNLTKAAEGFARRVGVPLSELVTQEIGGKQHLVAVITETGRPTQELITEILPHVIAELKFERTMRWNETQTTFARPIRWLVALLGDVVIDFQYAGVRSSNISHGPRPLGSQPTIIVSASSYGSTMAGQGIIVDIDQRQDTIQKQIEALASEVHGTALETAELLSEVTNLVEHPVAIRGGFDPSYLSLPVEVLTTVMRKHQRYFPITANGRLMPYFITVANGIEQHTDIVRHGNQEVIEARFSDALFFYETDTRKHLEAFIPQLHGLVFHEKLGSYFDKTERLKRLVPKVGSLANLSASEQMLALRTAELAKADLVTGMVVEFTDLQGIMGRYYALQSGEDERVARAIEEHYLPRSAEDSFPTSDLGLVVGLSDRIDSLVGLFSVGIKPTGTSDQFGLRRSALGLVQLLIHRNLSISLSAMTHEAAALFDLATTDPVVDEVVTYILHRLQGLLLNQGYRYDVIEAVLAARGDDPATAFATVRDLESRTQQAEFAPILRGYSRAMRIVRKIEQTYPVDPELFTEDVELDLYKAYVAAQKMVSPASPIADLVSALELMVEPINRFFDNVLVMDQDIIVRNNRIGLLQKIAAIPNGIVDLSRLEDS